MKIRWVGMEEYYEQLKGTVVVLDRNYMTGAFLVAPLKSRLIQASYFVYKKGRENYWAVIRSILKIANRRGWLRIDCGDLICWQNVKKWREAAKSRGV